MPKLKKNDFVEIEFTARVKGGDIFDTNIKKDAEKLDIDQKKIKPLVLSIGNKMIVEGLDTDLEGKEEGKKYSLEINPEKAFGKRNPQLVRMIPLKVFAEQNVQPQKGMQFSLDGQLVRIISVSGGRVLADFNNPLAGKVVTYDFKINKKVEDLKEKVNALQEFFFRKVFDFETKEKEITFKVPKEMEKFIELFSKNFEDILGVKIKAEPLKEEKKQEK
jgi:FKBP-type peptidyl-prolyl cis-trans isomerase 2